MNTMPKVRVSEKVRESIEQMIFSELKSGDRLPTEGRLVEMLGVSRTSVREAIKSLEAAKIVEKRNGGTYVCEQSEDCFVDPLCIMLQLDTIQRQHVMHVRKLLEVDAAGQAAMNADAEDIADLENILWKMQKPGIQLDEYIELDVQFHLAVAKASGNMMLYQLIKDIGAVLAKFFPRYCTLEIISSKAIPQQIEILNAIKNHQRESAENWMRMHLKECDELFKQ